MNWHNEPLGTIRYEELLNALLAIWKTRYSLARRLHNSELYEMYELGFEESLDAVAQLAGLEKLFEEGKSSHKARFDANEIAKPKLIEGQTTFIDITP